MRAVLPVGANLSAIARQRWLSEVWSDWISCKSIPNQMVFAAGAWTCNTNPPFFFYAMEVTIWLTASMHNQDLINQNCQYSWDYPFLSLSNTKREIIAVDNITNLFKSPVYSPHWAQIVYRVVYCVMNSRH